MNLTIVICCNKKDFFLAKICIASIRYYYPEIAIELVKDIGNGDFNTKDLEIYFNVRLVDLGIKKLGWSSAKFHYLYQMPKGKKVLILDADIVFAGPFLERMNTLYSENDYVVSADYNDDPYSDWSKITYFDTKKIEATFPAYYFPGFFFNAGQIFATVGSIDAGELDNYFDRNNYPFWKEPEIFPLVDQSVYNYLLPTLAREGKLSLGIAHFMLWSKSDATKNITLQSVVDGSFQGGLIHWAGDLRTPYLQKMTRCDILIFFEEYYLKKIPMGYVLKYLPKSLPVATYHLRKIYHRCKKNLPWFLLRKPDLASPNILLM